MSTETLSTTSRASRSLVVAVRQNGLFVPATRGFEDVPVDRAGLLLLEALGRGGPSRTQMVAEIAARAGVDAEAVDGLYEALVARQLIVEGDRPPLDESVEVRVRPDYPTQGLAPDQLLALPMPALLRVSPHGFEFFDHEGRVRARLDADELLAASHLRTPSSVNAVFATISDDESIRAFERDEFDRLVDHLVGAGLAVILDPDDPVNLERTRQTEAMRDAFRRLAQVNVEFDRLEAEHDARGGPVDRVRVLGVHDRWSYPPAALGIILAYLKGYQDGVLEESYDFRPRLLFDEERLAAAVAGEPVIALFTSYVWCHETSMRRSELIKSLSPHSVTVHGGPNIPKFEADCERFFAENPHVDVTVRGEGEVTAAEVFAALRGHVGDGPPDLSPLAEVPGISFRLGDRVIRTPDRERIADLDTIPSPILTGIFDGFIPVGPLGGLSLETNRGCPYGCTFCDWGSATLSRIRKFDLDRVFAELEWCAKHGFGIGLADANFGIFERDVEIAEKIAELRRTYGYPKTVGNNYAKNTVKHLSKIIEIFTDAGIVAEGKMSMQSMDEGTLSTIRRKNIKVEKYDDLSVEFSRNRLPLSVELMMGLPGSTVDTLRNDLQDCINRNVRANAYQTVLLPNSPMNDPEYRREHGIVARPGEVVKQTATYTRDDWDEMLRLNQAFSLSENFGVLRHVGSYVRAETGTIEMDFYDRLTRDALDDRERWPFIALTYQTIPNLMVPPLSWKFFIDDVRRYLVEVMGIADDSALDTVLTVQHALHPARDRVFPVELALDHDYAAWHRDLLDLRRTGHRDDWPASLRPLRTYPAGSLRIEDSFGVCSTAVGGTIESLTWESMWDFVSPVSRPRQRVREREDSMVGSA